MKYKEYLVELKSTIDDIKHYTPNGLVLTLTPIIKQFNLPTDPNAKWVFQHWRAMPRPRIGHKDQREFGYFVQDNGKLTYHIYPAEVLTILLCVQIIPLQWRGCYIPGRMPIAGNYFPNSEIVRLDENKLVLQKVTKNG